MLRSKTLAALVLIATAVPCASTPPAAAEEVHGLDLAGMNTKVKPGEDFFHYANGAWYDATEIPADRVAIGSFTVVDDLATAQVQELIQGAEKQAAADPKALEARKIADYYAAYLDEATIEKRGLDPIRGDFDKIAAISDKSALARFLGSELRADVDALNSTDFYTDRIFGLWVSPDFDDPTKNAAYLMQGGLGIPNREVYLGTDERSVALQGKYREHIAKLLDLAGIAKGEAATAAAERIYGFEKRIAEVHVSRTDSLDVKKANHRWLMSEFAAKAPGLDWKTYFDAARLGGLSTVRIWHPSATTGIAALVGSEPLALWKEYLTFRAVNRAAGLLPKAFADQSFAFYGTALSGATEMLPRPRRAVDATSGALGDAVGKLYVQKYFPPEAKAAAEAMVRNIIDAFAARIDKLDWMSPATRAKAKEKVATLRVGVGYPDRFEDYSALEVKRDDALGNARRAGLRDYASALARLGKPPDKAQWWMTPQTVNAVNLPLQNAMNFPAAILQPPFFDARTDIAQNYGGIGTVIGHEISHSFDDQGAMFDAQGRLADWWTAEDFKQFRKAADRLVAQYDAYEPLPGAHVNGTLTLSENIADVAGISAAYDGYRAAQAKLVTTQALNQGFTNDQRFFLSFAQIWRGKVRPEALRQSLQTNGHAPGMFRSWTVRNVGAWYDAFGVEPGEKMYLTPAERVAIW